VTGSDEIPWTRGVPHRTRRRKSSSLDISGPIKRDRTFFFASYEGRRVPWNFIRSRHGSNRAERNGDFSATPFDPSASVQDQLVADISTPVQSRRLGRRRLRHPVSRQHNSTSCLDPVAVDLMKRYVPCPNADPTAPISHPALPTASVPSLMTIPMPTSYVESGPQDSDKQNLSIYYYFNDSFDSQPFTDSRLLRQICFRIGNNSGHPAQQINVSHTWTISPVVVNELRLSLFPRAQAHSFTRNTPTCDQFLQFRGVLDLLYGTTDVPV